MRNEQLDHYTNVLHWEAFPGRILSLLTSLSLGGKIFVSSDLIDTVIFSKRKEHIRALLWRKENIRAHSVKNLMGFPTYSWTKLFISIYVVK